MKIKTTTQILRDTSFVEADEEPMKKEFNETWINLKDLIDWCKEFKPRSMQIDALLDRIKEDSKNKDGTE